MSKTACLHLTWQNSKIEKTRAELRNRIARRYNELNSHSIYYDMLKYVYVKFALYYKRPLNVLSRDAQAC